MRGEATVNEARDAALQSSTAGGEAARVKGTRSRQTTVGRPQWRGRDGEEEVEGAVGWEVIGSGVVCGVAVLDATRVRTTRR